MSVSKRLRFEVLRRDNYTCAYCGRRSPRVNLEIDHRTPRCMGGGDELDNLVAACWDCNRGKGPLDDEGPAYRREEERSNEFYDIHHAFDFSPREFPDCFYERVRQPLTFEFDVNAAMAELPKATLALSYTFEAIDEKADLF